MAKYQFKYYLHDNYEHPELVDFLSDERYGGVPKDVAEAIADSRPFYEVTLECEYDTETGETKILSARP